MKTRFLLFISFTLLISACEPPIISSFGCINKRIRNIETGNNYFQLIYDNENRLIERKLGLNTIEEFAYETGSIIQKVPNLTTTITTDNTILPDKILIRGSYDTSPSGITPVSKVYYFDSGGYLTQLNTQKANIITKYVYTWQAGNLIKIVMTRNLLFPLSQTTTFTYHNNLINSTSNEFMGLGFYGKESYNAVKNITITSTGQPTVSRDFTYRVDDCGCITQSIELNSANTTISNFTYEKVSQ